MLRKIVYGITVFILGFGLGVILTGTDDEAEDELL
jgi:hypothetical protein